MNKLTACFWSPHGMRSAVNMTAPINLIMHNYNTGGGNNSSCGGHFWGTYNAQMHKLGVSARSEDPK